MPDLSFLPQAERRVARMLIAAGLVFVAGFKVRDLIGNAQAAEARVHRLERSVTRMDRNMLAIATKLNVAIETEVDEDVAAARVGP